MASIKSSADQGIVAVAPPRTDNNTVDKLIQLNDLTYTMPTSLSVMVNSRYTKYPFNQSLYRSDQTATCVIQSGDLWLSPQDSYLTFGVYADALWTDATVAAVPNVSGAMTQNNRFLISWGYTSAAVIIDNIILEDESGTEIENVRDVGLRVTQNDYYTYSGDAFSNIALQNQGYDLGWDYIAQTATQYADNANQPGLNASYHYGMYNSNIKWYGNLNNHAAVAGDVPDRDTTARFAVPLSKILGFFNVNKLLPSYVCSGLRLKISFKPDPDSVFTYTLVDAPLTRSVACLPGTTDTDGITWLDGKKVYYIEDMQILTKAYMLTDSVHARLNEIAAKQGLVIMFESCFSESYTSSSNKLSLQIKKGVSRANRAMAIVQDNRAANANYQFKTGLGWEFFSIATPDHPTKWQWRLGSTYYPAHLCDSELEQIIYACDFYNRSMQTRSSNCVTHRTFKNRNNVVTCVLERSKILALSGLPIQASHLLVLDMQFATSIERYVTAFLYYTNVLNVFNDRTILSS